MAAGFAGLAAAQEITWTIGHVNVPGTSYIEVIKTVPDRIATATDGRLKIELYDTLVPGPEQPAAVRDGRLDGSFAIGVWLSAEAPLLNVSLLPDLINSASDFQKILDPVLWPVFSERWAAQYNAKLLAVGVFEQQVIISKEPIHTAEDFSGKKVRVSNTAQASMMNALGAVPTAVPFGEIVPALQRGVVDVVMTSVGPANGMGFYTVVSNFAYWGITPVQPWSLIVNQESWAALPDDLKEIVAKEFRAIQDDEFAKWDAFNKSKVDELVSHGMTPFQAPPEEVAKVHAPGNIQQAYDDWYKLNEAAGTDGRAFVEQIRAALQQ